MGSRRIAAKLWARHILNDRGARRSYALARPGGELEEHHRTGRNPAAAGRTRVFAPLRVLDFACPQVLNWCSVAEYSNL